MEKEFMEKEFMEKASPLEPLEIAAFFSHFCSIFFGIFYILVWFMVMIEQRPFIAIFYGVLWMSRVLVNIFARKRRYFNRQENVAELVIAFIAGCIFFLNHAGIFPVGAAFSFLGVLSNSIVISVNGFHMPVSQLAEHLIAEQKNYYLYVFHGPETKLKFLSDIITIGKHRVTISVGDIFIIFGQWIMFIETCRWFFCLIRRGDLLV